MNRLAIQRAAASLALCGCAAGVETAESEEQTSEDEQALGLEDQGPYSPGTGWHDTGGPGYGWGSPRSAPPSYPPRPSGRTPEQQRIHDANQAAARRTAAIDATHAYEGWGARVKWAAEAQHGKGIEANRAACRYACRTTSRDVCAQITLACSCGAAYLWLIPEVPISCGVAMMTACAGATPMCYAACAAAKD